MFGKSKKCLKQEIKQLTEKLCVLSEDNKVLHDLFDEMGIYKSEILSVRFAYLDKRLSEALYEMRDADNKYGIMQKLQERFKLFKFTFNNVKKLVEHGYVTRLGFSTHAVWPKNMISAEPYITSARKIRKFLLPALEDVLKSENVAIKIEYGDDPPEVLTLIDYNIMPSKNIIQEILNYSKSIAESVLPPEDEP